MVEIALWQAALLGIVQGLTEFLPISSSGHLILVPALFGWADSLLGRLDFTVALHVGTLLALVAVFWNDWLRLGRAALVSVARRSLHDPDARLAWLIALGTVPGAVAGAAFESLVEAAFRSPASVAVMLVAVGLLMAAADRWALRLRDERSLGTRSALAIGLAQAAAIIPGVSRSGITIAVGLMLGLTRPAAARFSFLLSAPIIAGAALKQAMDLARAGGIAAADLSAYGIGILAAAVSGFAAIKWLLGYLSRGGLMPFVIYRLALGAAILIATGTGALR